MRSKAAPYPSAGPIIGTSREPGLAVRLDYRPPLDWTATVSYLRARATEGVESVDTDVYRRTIEIGGRPGIIEVRAVPGESHLLLRAHGAGPEHRREIETRVRRIFDLDADLPEIAAVLGRDRRMASMVRKRPGVRVPGVWDGFEFAVRAILGQQITVRAATTLAGRLAEKFGDSFPAPVGHGLKHLFPRADRLKEEPLEGIGIPRARADTIRLLARAVADGSLNLEFGRPPDLVKAGLRRIPGIGEWTAEIVAMRALKEPDAFPSTDLGLLRAAGTAEGRIAVQELLRRAERWRPWRAYAAMHLWVHDAQIRLLPAGSGRDNIRTRSSDMSIMYCTYMESPAGGLLLAGTDEELKRIEFPSSAGPRKPEAGWRETAAPFQDCIRQLEEYFRGMRRSFELRLAPDGTEFQRAVWTRLLEIPYGETVTYGEIARKMGKPDAVRAVGAANGRNPIPIVIPCHRVIGSNGKLVGYGGGLRIKELLLGLEGARLPY